MIFNVSPSKSATVYRQSNWGVAFRAEFFMTIDFTLHWSRLLSRTTKQYRMAPNRQIVVRLASVFWNSSVFDPFLKSMVCSEGISLAGPTLDSSELVLDQQKLTVGCMRHWENASLEGGLYPTVCNSSTWIFYRFATGSPEKSVKARYHGSAQVWVGTPWLLNVQQV